MLKQFSAATLVSILTLNALGAAEAPTTSPAAGTFEAYQTAAKATLAEYQKLIPKPEGLADAEAAHRDAVAAQAIPLVKSILVNLDHMADVRPDIKRPILATRLNQEAVVYALGDADTIASLEQKIKAGGRDGELASNVVLRGKWLRAGTDAAKQADLIQDTAKVAAAQPKDIFLAQFIADIRPKIKDPAGRDQLMDVMTKTLDNPTAKALVNVMKATDKTMALEGKPLVLTGKTPEGRDFTTADWKGKVILVDFWAVWCVPCRMELPRVKKVYEQYHDKGLEVLGVDSDYDAETVIKFSASEKLPWPQLFDADAAADQSWHPLTRQFGITGIPTMFLIDKNGVCRTVSAREDFEPLIPKLLAE